MYGREKIHEWSIVYNKIFEYILKKFGDSFELADFIVHSKRFKKILELISKYGNYNSKIIDIGCAPGHTYKMIQLCGYVNIIGLDIHPEKNLYTDIRTIKFDLEKIPDCSLPLKDESFDIVILTEVFEHLHPYKVKDILMDIKRILKKEGVVIFSTPNLASLENRVALLLGGISKYRRGTIVDPCHTREYTYKELRYMFTQELGFKVLETFYQSPRQFVAYVNSHKVSVKNNLLELLKHPSFRNLARFFLVVPKFLFPSFRETIWFVLTK